ncbi:unnamed protein product [Hymenolepis diminuta]|uniref:Vacuolar protein sorting-associated protein 72 homolog n=1 Tax=Hymenolepis diminuta TaxID=6216 RepID=A0A0R3S8G7_HYMDI|nr:unnamed protein product [Hymenolepis diminuta]VUZ43292.1 unnamed protein product [Hymenolepis diminuta]
MEFYNQLMSLIIENRFKNYSGGLELLDTSSSSDAEISEDERMIMGPQSIRKVRKLPSTSSRMNTDFPDGAVLEKRSYYISPKASCTNSKAKLRVHFEENTEDTELTETSPDSLTSFDENYVNSLEITPMEYMKGNSIQRKKLSPKSQHLFLPKSQNEMLTAEEMPDMCAPWNTALLIAHNVYMAAHPPKSNITLLELAQNRCEPDPYSERLLSLLKARHKYY